MKNLLSCHTYNINRCILIFIFFFYCSLFSLAQTGGQLIRLNNVANTTTMQNISDPQAGALVYVENRNTLFLFDGNEWNALWSNQGNLGSDSSFIGTISNQDFNIRTNNQQQMVVKNNGNVGINLSNPTGLFQVNTASLTTNNNIGLSGTASSNANSPSPSNANVAGDPLFGNDNNNSTAWLSASVFGDYVNYWYKIDLGANNAQVVNKYQIVKHYSNFHPTSWEFQASNDDINWINLDVLQGSVSWNWGSQITRTFANTSPYRYYRWFMHRGYYEGSWYSNFAIREFRLFAAGDSDTNLEDDFIVSTNGNVGIGINPTQKLHVNGNILATGTITPDYVFQKYYEGKSKLNPEYQFNSLEKTERFIEKNKHLPGVPSAKKIKDQGGIIINHATEINLEKIEELYLHIFELNDRIKKLEKELRIQKKSKRNSSSKN